jgi:LuxR family maltose regulon positive regulatory protein
VLQGCLHEASAIYEQAALFASQQETSIYTGTEHACRGDLSREWNQLEQAAPEIHKGIELAEAGDHIFFLTDVYLASVRLALAQRDWESAWNSIQKAEQVTRRCPTSIEIEDLQSWRARLHLAQGNLAEAGLWAETRNTEIASPLDPQHESELLTLARIWLAQGKADQASSLLERVRITAQEAGRHGRALEAQMLHALADHAAGKDVQAVEELIQVLAGAESEGYVRLFIDEGAPMARLLHQVTTRTTSRMHDYAEALMTAYLHEEAEGPARQAKPLPGDELIKPLSERELEVLRLVAAGKTNLDIATELYIAIGTVKRHTVNIFTKLDVKNRTEAVAKARQLALL